MCIDGVCTCVCMRTHIYITFCLTLNTPSIGVMLDRLLLSQLLEDTGFGCVGFKFNFKRVIILIVVVLFCFLSVSFFNLLWFTLHGSLGN